MTNYWGEYGEMEIEAFIFSWNKVHKNVSGLVPILEKFNFENLYVISSGKHPYSYEKAKLIEISSDSFYGNQFHAATTLFKGDLMLQVQGDVTCEFKIDLEHRLREIFLNPEIAIWTPEINFTSWNEDVAGYKVDGNRYFNRKLDSDIELKDFMNPDSTFWAIRSWIISEYKNLPLHNSHFGWGIDITLAAIAFLGETRVVRDSLVNVKHPRGTGYNQDLAIEEWLSLFERLPNDIKILIKFISVRLHERSLKYNNRLFIRLKNFISKIYYEILS